MLSTVFQEGMYFLDFGAGFSTGVDFIPSDLPNLLSWFRADDLTTSGSSVTQWNDKGSSAYHLTPGTAPTLLSSVAAINNQPAIRFNGTNQYLFNSSLSQAAGYHVFVVVAGQTGGSSVNVICDANSTEADALSWIGGSVTFRMFSGANVNCADAVADATWFVGDWWWQGASSAITVNNGTPTTGDPGTISSSGFRVGRRGSASVFYGQFDIAEIIVSTARIIGDDLTNLHGYLNARYGFSN